MAMPIAVCENFVFAGGSFALLYIALSTAEEDRTYLAMKAKDDIAMLEEAQERSELLLKAHKKMRHEEKKEQL
jgi:hypothetical protein